MKHLVAELREFLSLPVYFVGWVAILLGVTVLFVAAAVSGDDTSEFNDED